ncbi:MAG: type II secretion system protein GspD [bacterium]|nr:type II secretion system protein GspD [bacterium]
MRLLTTALTAAFLACSIALPAGPASARETELVSYSETPAADGSVQLVLDFDGFAPSSQVVHAKRNDVKVLMFGVERGPKLPGVFAPAGEIRAARIAPFAGVGLLVDLTLKNDVVPRVETVGSRIVVHIPAYRSDEEAHLPGPVPAQAEGVKVVPLSYADVSEVAGLIKSGIAVPSVDNFSAQSPFAQPTPGSSSMSSSYNGAQGTATTPSYVTLPTYALIPKDTPQGVFINDHVSVDRRLNAVILRGTPSEIEPYERLISLVDTPQRSVLLETQIVELTETGEYDLGINYSPNGQLATATFGAGTVAGALTGNGRPSSNVSLSAQLDALQTKGQAKILAQPRILAIDNRMAAILSGEAVPIFTSVVVPSGGTTILQQQLQYINVGVSLEILPRISTDGHVTADIFSEVSSILSYVQTAPRIAVRQELTAATVKDGQSVIIGGLLQDQEIKSMSKIPGLGDIPILGEFFRQTTSTSQKTNLYLVITPHVLSKSYHGADAPK